MQIIKLVSPKEISITEKENSFLDQKNARKWISIGGIIIVSTALVFAYLSHYELVEKFTVAASAELETEVVKAEDEAVVKEQFKVEKESEIKVEKKLKL